MADTVSIQLFATLGRFARGGRTRFTLAWHPGMDVQAVLDSLKIPDTVERVVLVNRRYTPADGVLSPGDTLAIFPPMTGG